MSRSNAYNDAPDFPRIVGLETTAFCNARCFFCPLHGPEADMERRKGVMTMALFEKMAAELRQHRDELLTIYLNLDGDPLVDPLFESRLVCLRSHDLAGLAQIQTNGQFLTDAASRAILEAGIGQITLGFDGASKEVYEAHRIGCSYERVLENVHRFLSRRRASASSTRLAIQFVRTASNEHELEAAYEMWQRVLDPDRDSFFNTISKAWATPRLDASPLILETLARMGPDTVACPMLRESFNVLFDGRVPVCCWDYNVDIVEGGLGNVTKQTISEVWQSAPLARLRQQHSAGNWSVLPRCSGCTMTRPVTAQLEYPGIPTRFGVVRRVEPLDQRVLKST